MEETLEIEKGEKGLVKSIFKGLFEAKMTLRLPINFLLPTIFIWTLLNSKNLASHGHLFIDLLMILTQIMLLIFLFLFYHFHVKTLGENVQHIH